nr:unnamed protein product [Callosobruchus analis]
MIFACEDCRQDVKKYRNNPIGQLQNQIDKLEETVNKLQVESKDMLNILTEKMMQANAETATEPKPTFSKNMAR